jgi:ABC-type transport system involved in multi-copper enzyme maturation permease subunit
LFAGPIIAREVITAPRPIRFYVARASYVGLLFVLMWTAWQSLIGWRDVREFGVIARFGGILYGMFAILQLTLILFFAPLFTAASIAHEKDRRTFILLLMTDLSDLEIVLGKLIAGLMNILAALAAGVGMLSLCTLFGGISFGQVATLFAVTASSGVAGGAMGLVVALWRDRSFQSISLTILMVVFSVTGVEAFARAFPTVSAFGIPVAEVLNPYRALLAVLYPRSNELGGVVGASSLIYILVRLSAAALLVAFAAFMLRIWNPGRNEPREQREGEGEAEVVETLIEVDEAAVEAPVAVASATLTVSGSGAGSGPDASRFGAAAMTATTLGGSGSSTSGEPGPTTGLHVPRRTHRRITRAAKTYRAPWSNPILWREMMTRAYGTKPLIIKGAYALIFVIGVALFQNLSIGMESPLSSLLAMIPVSLGILSLVLVNAQGVTALTSERDSGALDLLLVTELSPKEFIYGKLYGVLYNSKEMIVLPVVWTLWLTWSGAMIGESAFFGIVDFLLLCHFSAMLGLHSAITYTNSRAAVANSLGTIFFLMVGILVCAYLIMLSDREFGRQLLSFLIFIGAGSVALFGSLGAKNPSRAIALVSLLTPFWSFYCIISLLNGDIMAAFLFSCGIYGFALLAMLVPAVSDFDIALGRTSAIQG